MEIAENSENNLKAIVCGRQMAEVDGVSDRGGKVVEKTQGEGKASKSRARYWHSSLPSANYNDLRAVPPFLKERGWATPPGRFERLFFCITRKG